MILKKETHNLVYYDNVLKWLRGPENLSEIEFLKDSMTEMIDYIIMLKGSQGIMLSKMDVSNGSIIVKPDENIYKYLENICNYQIVYLSKLNNNNKSLNEIVERNRELFIQKNNDYGSSFEDFGFLGIIVRLNDKINRIKSLISKGGSHEVNDESLNDSVQDLYNYCVLSMMYKFKND